MGGSTGGDPVVLLIADRGSNADVGRRSGSYRLLLMGPQLDTGSHTSASLLVQRSEAQLCQRGLALGTEARAASVHVAQPLSQPDLLAIDLFDVPLRHLKVAFSVPEDPSGGQAALEGALSCRYRTVCGLGG